MSVKTISRKTVKPRPTPLAVPGMKKIKRIAKPETPERKVVAIKPKPTARKKAAPQPHVDTPVRVDLPVDMPATGRTVPLPTDHTGPVKATRERTSDVMAEAIVTFANRRRPSVDHARQYLVDKFTSNVDMHRMDFESSVVVLEAAHEKIDGLFDGRDDADIIADVRATVEKDAAKYL